MAAQEGVYVGLDELIAYQALTAGMAVSFAQVSHNLLTGNRPSRINGRGGAFDQVRAYLHGDDVRDIDWNVTARMGGAPYVRVFNEERQRMLVVLVDQTNDMFFGTRRQLKSVLAARIAAQLLWMAHHRKQPHGLVIVQEKTLLASQVREHRGHLLNNLAQLAMANQALSAGQGETQAGAQMPLALQRMLQLSARGALVVLISDFHAFDEAAWSLFGQLAARTQGLALPVYDGILDHWPQEGQFLATYGGIQTQLQIASGAQRDAIKAQAEGNLALLQQRIAKAGMGMAPMTTYRDANEQLCEALGLAGGSP